MNKDLLYEGEVYKIVGAAIEVHRELGPGFLETVYEEAMVLESTEKRVFGRLHRVRKNLGCV